MGGCLSNTASRRDSFQVTRWGRSVGHLRTPKTALTGLTWSCFGCFFPFGMRLLLTDYHYPRLYFFFWAEANPSWSLSFVKGNSALFNRGSARYPNILYTHMASCGYGSKKVYPNRPICKIKKYNKYRSKPVVSRDYKGFSFWAKPIWFWKHGFKRQKVGSLRNHRGCAESAQPQAVMLFVGMVITLL